MVAIQNKAKTQENQFNTGIVLVPEPQKSQMIAARKGQAAAAEAALAAADKAGVKWKPLFPLALKSFDSLKTALATEAPRLEKLPVADMRNSITATQAAEEELKANHLGAVETKLKEAQSLWQQNAQIAVLTAEVTAIKTKPTPAPAEASANPTGGKNKKKATPQPTPEE
jgi:hypothetical protein